MKSNLEILKIALELNHYGDINNLIKNYYKLHSLIYEIEENQNESGKC